MIHRCSGVPSKPSRLRGPACGAAGLLLAVLILLGLACGRKGSAGASPDHAAAPPRPLLIVSLDAFHPGYLDLDSRGRAGGADGDWLTPNLHRFLDGATRFADARDYLPAATDMNHLNALAGTSSAQTGVLWVSTQVFNWNPDGTARLVAPDLAWTRDDRGRAVDTLFQSWKRKWPGSKTFLVTGTAEVGEMFRSAVPAVDFIVMGPDHPSYLPDPAPYSAYDPPSDPDAACDPESPAQTFVIDALTQMTPQGNPSDAWIADASLAVLTRELPDFGFILLSETDEAQHGLGTAWNPDEFEPADLPYVPPSGCADNEDWQWTSRRNPPVYRDAVLDAIREVDAQFGRLIDGIRATDHYRDATIVVYSDHGQVTHLFTGSVASPENAKITDAVGVLHDAGLLSQAQVDGAGFIVLSGSSLGEAYWKADTLEERRALAAQAKQVLLAYRAVNPETGRMECPWDVLDQLEMRDGVPGLAGPGERWHDYFGPDEGADELLWPDLLLFMRNGWQIPVYHGLFGNLNVVVPDAPPMSIFNGGHGGPDTQAILMAMSGPGVAQGRVLDDPEFERNYRISDIAVTAASLFGLTLTSATVGRDRSSEIGAGQP